MNTVIQAKPLLEMALDAQIRAHGGRGYNCGVKIKPNIGSYSCQYTFDTPEGEKTLITQNTLNLGLVDGNFVVHDGDTGEFKLITVKEIDRAPYRLSYEKVLGVTYQEMMWALQLIWPNQIIWQLNIPEALRLSTGKVIAKALH